MQQQQLLQQSSEQKSNQKPKKKMFLLGDLNIDSMHRCITIFINWLIEFLDWLSSNSYLTIFQWRQHTCHSRTLIGNIFSNVIKTWFLVTLRLLFWLPTTVLDLTEYVNLIKKILVKFWPGTFYFAIFRCRLTQYFQCRSKNVDLGTNIIFLML